MRNPKMMSQNQTQHKRNDSYFTLYRLDFRSSLPCVFFLLLVSTYGLILGGCSAESQFESQTLNQNRIDSSSWSEEELQKADAQWDLESQTHQTIALRTVLGELQGSLIQAEDFLSSTFDPVQTLFTLEGNPQIQNALKGTLEAERFLRTSSTGQLRIDAYTLKGEIEPLRLFKVQNQIITAFPFKMTAGSTVRFIRLFESIDEAQNAPLLTPLALPFTLEKALTLPAGCVVEIPVEAQLSLNVNGQLLGQTWQWIPQWASWLTTTATGFFSALAQGGLFMKTRLTLWVTKLEQNQVRVRISQGNEMRVEGRLSNQLGGSTYARFLPASQVEKVKKYKDQILKWAQTPSSWLSSFEQRLNQLKTGAPRVLQLLLNQADQHALPTHLVDLLEFSQPRLDQALELIEKGSILADRAHTWFDREIQSRLQGVDDRLNPLFNRVKKYSEHLFNLNSRVELSLQNLERFTHFGEYLFDLKTEIGRDAYLRVVGGQSQWKGFSIEGFQSKGWIDLTVIDGLVKDQVEGVKRLQSTKIYHQQQQGKWVLNAPLVHHQVSQDQDQYRFVQESSEFGTEEWNGSVWRFERQLKAGSVQESEQIKVGSLSQLRFDQEQENEGMSPTLDSSTDSFQIWSQGGLWMTWKKTWPTYQPTPIEKSIHEIFNLTGRLAQDLGFAHLYQNDHPGQVSTELTLVWTDLFLELLFTQLHEDQLWSVIADVADSFDNQFGLPFLTSFQRPPLYSNAHQASCDRIAYQWGSRYCWWVYEDVMLPFLRLQMRHLDWKHDVEEARITEDEAFILQKELQSDELDFLRNFFEHTLLLNPIGPRLSSRILSEIVVLLDAHDALLFKMSIRHPSHPETLLFQEWGQGSDQVLAMVEMLGGF